MVSPGLRGSSTRSIQAGLSRTTSSWPTTLGRHAAWTFTPPTPGLSPQVRSRLTCSRYLRASWGPGPSWVSPTSTFNRTPGDQSISTSRCQREPTPVSSRARSLAQFQTATNQQVRIVHRIGLRVYLTVKGSVIESGRIDSVTSTNWWERGWPADPATLRTTFVNTGNVHLKLSGAAGAGGQAVPVSEAGRDFVVPRNSRLQLGNDMAVASVDRHPARARRYPLHQSPKRPRDSGDRRLVHPLEGSPSRPFDSHAHHLRGATGRDLGAPLADGGRQRAWRNDAHDGCRPSRPSAGPARCASRKRAGRGRAAGHEQRIATVPVCTTPFPAAR